MNNIQIFPIYTFLYRRIIESVKIIIVRKIAILFLLIFSSFVAASQTLNIQINKIKNDKGEILVSLYNNEQGFPYEATSSIKTFSVKASKGSVVLTAKQLKPGTYAIALFHDADGNRKLTTNILGIPKEGYAFSNNASNFFGIPSFKDASFKLNADTTILINMKHF